MTRSPKSNFWLLNASTSDEIGDKSALARFNLLQQYQARGMSLLFKILTPSQASIPREFGLLIAVGKRNTFDGARSSQLRLTGFLFYSVTERLTSFSTR
jgi:hypothetical protein